MCLLSIIIVSYNTRELLRACLSSIVETLASDVPYEIIVVDNASVDGSVEMLREFPQVKLVESEKNLGFAAANNRGLALSSGRYLLLLNSDTVLRKGALQELVDFLETHPGVGVVTGRLMYGDGSFQHSAFSFPTLWMTFFDFFPLNHRFVDSRLNGRYPKGAYAAPFEIDHPLGACMMVRREVLEQVGPLSEDYFMYCEEIDWCLRIKAAGWRIYCQPKAEIVHYGGQSTRQFWADMFIELHRSRFRLFRRHYSPLFQLAAKAIVSLGLARETMRAWWHFRRGSMSRSEYEDRMRAHRGVFLALKEKG